MSLEADTALVDQADELIRFYRLRITASDAFDAYAGTIDNPKGDPDHVDVAAFRNLLGDFLAKLLTLPVPQSYQWMRYLMAEHKLMLSNVRPRQWEDWIAYIHEYHQAFTGDWPEVNYTIELVRIAREHGREAAMLFKLSEGNIKPKVRHG